VTAETVGLALLGLGLILAALSWIQLTGRTLNNEVNDYLWEAETRRLLPELYDDEDRP